MDIDPSGKIMIFTQAERAAGMPAELELGEAARALENGRDRMRQELQEAQRCQMDPFTANKGKLADHAHAAVTLGKMVRQLAELAGEQEAADTDLNDEFKGLLS